MEEVVDVPVPDDMPESEAESMDDNDSIPDPGPGPNPPPPTFDPVVPPPPPPILPIPAPTDVPSTQYDFVNSSNKPLTGISHLLYSRLKSDIGGGGGLCFFQPLGDCVGQIISGFCCKHMKLIFNTTIFNEYVKTADPKSDDVIPAQIRTSVYRSRANIAFNPTQPMVYAMCPLPEFYNGELQITDIHLGNFRYVENGKMFDLCKTLNWYKIYIYRLFNNDFKTPTNQLKEKLGIAVRTGIEGNSERDQRICSGWELHMHTWTDYMRTKLSKIFEEGVPSPWAWMFPNKIINLSEIRNTSVFTLGLSTFFEPFYISCYNPLSGEITKTSQLANVGAFIENHICLNGQGCPTGSGVDSLGTPLITTTIGHIPLWKDNPLTSSVQKIEYAYGEC